MKEDRAKKLAEQALSDLKAELDAGMSDTLLKFIECLSRFHQYSWMNCMLIALQQPGRDPRCRVPQMVGAEAACSERRERHRHPRADDLSPKGRRRRRERDDCQRCSRIQGRPRL